MLDPACGVLPEAPRRGDGGGGGGGDDGGNGDGGGGDVGGMVSSLGASSL